MENHYITLKDDDGWRASISKAFTPPGSPNAVAIGESVSYPTKQAAWAIISEKAESLDYLNDDIRFNNTVVESYEEVQKMVDAL